MEKILIHSYKGGTGKTTVALNTASLLSENYRILLVESDFIMPSFYFIFKNEPSQYFNDYFHGKSSFSDIIIGDVRKNIDVIFTNKEYDPSEKIFGADQNWFLAKLQILMNYLDKLKTKYDFVIFDTPPGWHLIVVNLIMLANKAILILRPNSYAVS